jgi:enoyl-[acyl-carrier protein] reductase/trans-2-enoyl-CoA reductase (NAD+)
MKERELHEGCIEQIVRLFHKLYDEVPTPVDGLGRIRIDDWEMQPEVQRAVAEIWADITTENLTSVADLEGYRADFLKLFGFGLAGVDYEKETEPHRTIA